MAIPRAELIAGFADHWHRQGAALPITHRRRILRALADVSPMLRSWGRWERLFSPLYLLGVACTSFGILALALDVWPLVTGGLVFAGTVMNALLAAHLVRTTRQALDIATGLAASRYYLIKCFRFVRFEVRWDHDSHSEGTHGVASG